MGVKIRLLGGFILQVGSDKIKELSARHQSLIAYLALSPQSPVPRSEIAFHLWGDSKESQALTNLRKVLHQLRNSIHSGELIKVNSRTLQLNLAQDDSIDVIDFFSQLNAAESARLSNDRDGEQNALETASMIYQGDLLPNCYDEWILPERERLRNLFIRATDRLVALFEARQYYRDAIKQAQRLLQVDNLREETYRILIRLYALSDDRAAALNTYHTCARVLSEELGVDPDRSTRELYEQLLKSDIRLLRARIPEIPVSHPLVGREEDWKALITEWQRASQGNLSMVVLRGEPGIGKTRLAEDFLRWAARQGNRTSFTTCYSAQGNLSYTPLITWLRSMPLADLDQPWQEELSRILPELRNENFVSRPITEGWQKQIFFEALARAVIAHNEPLLLLLDDLQWCDADTLEWLRYFMQFNRKARILVLATLRAGDLQPRPGLQSLFSDLRVTGQLVEIKLARLSNELIISLGVSVIGKDLSQSESERLFRESEGVPLFVVELARAGLGGGSINRTEADDGEDGGLPPRLQAVLDSRLARLSSPARSVLEAASVLGREFSFELLKRTSDLEEGGTVQALDELWQRRMVRERGRGQYDFSHEKLREATLAGISPVRIHWLHQRAAEALEASHPNENALIADHYERAGVAQRAAEYYARAARYERDIFSLQDALAYLTRAILLETDHEKLANLHEDRGDILGTLELRDDSYHAFTLAYGLTDQHLKKARLARKQLYLKSRYEEALTGQVYRLAMDELKDAEEGPEYWNEWIEIQFAWIQANYWKQDAEGMAQMLKKIESQIKAYGTPAQQLEYQHKVIANALVRERYRANEKTRAMARENVTHSRALDDIHRTASSYLLLGLATLAVDAVGECEKAFEECLRLCKQTGDKHTLLIARTYLSLVHRLQGHTQAVKEDVREMKRIIKSGNPVPHYEAIADAQEAWLAYRAGKIETAHQYARKACETWGSLEHPFPMQWPGLFILFALSVTEKSTSLAHAYAQRLLGAPLQRLAPEVESALLSTQEVDPSDQRHSLSRLENALNKVHEAGYL